MCVLLYANKLHILSLGKYFGQNVNIFDGMVKISHFFTTSHGKLTIGSLKYQVCDFLLYV